MPKPRIRTIKPELADNEKVARLDHEAFRVYVCAITQADDAGTFPASDGHLLRYLGFRGEPRLFAAIRGELSREGFVVFYTARGSTYGRIHDWGVHQRIDNARKDPGDYYPAPSDGVAITRFPPPSGLPAASRREPPRAADARREPPRAAAGSDPDREGKGPGRDQDPVALGATGRRKREPLPYKATDVYDVLAAAMPGVFVPSMPQGEDVPAGIAIAVNKVLREAARLGYTLEDFRLAGEYTAAYARALGNASMTLTPAWVAQTDANKGGLLKATLNAKGWHANGRPPLGRQTSTANGQMVLTGDELRAAAAEMRAKGM